MSTDVMQLKANSLKSLLNSARKEIEAALPKHVTPDRMMRIALTEARKTPKLLACNPASFLGAVIQASQLGLEPGGALGHCYLIPYGSEVNFQIGYRGMIDLVLRSDKVSYITARAVHQGDQFEVELGLNEALKHIPGDEDTELTHVYCVVHLKDGTKMFDVMSRKQIERVRSKSKSGNSGPWVDHFEEMAKKSVIRRLFKYMPISVELQKAVGLDELGDVGEQNNASFIETTGRSVMGKAEELSSKLSESFGDEEEVVEAKPPTAFDSFTGTKIADPKVVK